jgi:selenocysteine lyase/cysteine desulfurase
MPELQCQKEHFALPPDVHYLNCAYMSPLSREVEEAGLSGLRGKRNPSEIVEDDFFRVPELVRRRFAGLIGCPDPTSVALIPSVSYGIALAAANADVQRGQNIVLLSEQFPSNVYSWTRLRDERGAELRLVERGLPVRDWNARILEAIDGDTAVVTVPHVHWTDGTRFDLDAIRKACDRSGALLVVDGTQSVGALPFDVLRYKPDALVCAGYKWLFGPYGYGMAYFGARLLHGRPLEENWINRAGSENFGGLVRYRDEYQPGAVRYDFGERSNFILAPMMLAALDQVIAWEPARIQDYCDRLTAATVGNLIEAGYRIVDSEDRSAHIFGIRLPPGLSADRVGRALRDRGVSVSSRGDAIRVSPHIYNDETDILALEDALTSVVAHTT